VVFLGGEFSLHSLRSGERLMQHAKKVEFKVLARIAFRTRFISMEKGTVYLGD